MRIDAALDQYLLQLAANGRTDHTLQAARRHIGLLATWAGDVAVEDLTHHHAAGFLVSDVARLTASGKPRSEVTLNALRSTLRGFGAYLHAAGLAERNFAALVRLARVGPRHRQHVGAADIERVLAAMARDGSPAARRDLALFSLLYLTGSRISAALAATTDDLDLAAGTLHLRRVKGGGSLIVDLPPRLRFLVSGLEPGPLFPSRQGGPMTRRQAGARLAMWADRVGVTGLTPHGLRRAYATSRYAATRDLVGVQRALGHASPGTTERYVAMDR